MQQAEGSASEFIMFIYFNCGRHFSKIVGYFFYNFISLVSSYRFAKKLFATPSLTPYRRQTGHAHTFEQFLSFFSFYSPISSDFP